MNAKTQQISEMIEMLPETDQNLAFELIKKLVLAWDPDYTKLTPKEKIQLEKSQNEGYISFDEIDWD